MRSKNTKNKSNIKIKSNAPKSTSNFSKVSRSPKITSNIKTKEVPPKYRELKANLYNKTIQKTLYDVNEVPICKCNPKDGCNENCINRQLFMECGVGCCPTLKKNELYCNNTVLQTKKFPKLQVFRTNSRGWALKVMEDVQENTILIEYLGEVLNSEEVMNRMSKYKVNDDFYFASLDGGLMLDAKTMGSVARFANHSCNPNSTLEKWIVQGEPRIALVSQKPLSKGTEVTYNYQYFDDGLDLPRQPCYCGSPKCS